MVCPGCKKNPAIELGKKAWDYCKQCQLQDPFRGMWWLNVGRRNDHR